MPLEIKPPSATDRSVTLTIPKEKDPYFVEWYQNTKQPGETINNFMLRNLSRLVRGYYLSKVIDTDTETIESDTIQQTSFLEA